MSSDTITSNDNDPQEQNKGFFFKKIRSMRRNSGTNKNHDKHRSNSNSPFKTNNNKGDKTKLSSPSKLLQKRRMFKATRPPSPPTADVSVSSETDIDIRSNSNNKIPTIQNENLREKTEQWRQERVTKTVAIQKSNKEKEIMLHRHRKSSADGGEMVEGKSKHVDLEVSGIFKTRTFHPEHKRKGSSDDHVEKKTKLDDQEAIKENIDSERITDLVEKEPSLPRTSSSLPRWMSVVVPATIVAACAIVAVRVMRRR